MKKMKLLLLLFFCLTQAVTYSQAFIPGNVVVLRIGDESADLSKAAPVFLDEYTPAGSFVRTIALPVTTTGTNNKFTLVGTNLTFGSLGLSPDGRYLSAAAFDAPVGASFEDLVDLPIYDRTVAIVDFNGNVNTSTKLLVSDVGTNYPNSSITSNGTDIWATFANTGVRYCIRGASTSALIQPTATFRTVRISDGNLFGSTSNGRIWQIGTGLPTSPGQPMTQLNGIASGLSSTTQFYFADLNPAIPGADVLYTATVDAIALRKYSYNASTATWVLNGVIGVNADDYTGITGTVNDDGSVTLFITRKTGSPPAGGGQLVTLTDNTGYTLAANSFTGTPALLATAANKTGFRGVAMAPVSCKRPSISFGSITPTGADINWTTGVPGNSYEYSISTSPTPPVSGTGTSSTTYSATGLTPGLQYYVHVRSYCGGTDYSSWKTASFTTTWPPCVIPTFLPVIHNSTNNTTTLNWNPVLSAVQYEYAITSSAIAPANGNFTSQTSYTANGLSSTTTYYFHIRTYCGSGDTSAWTNTAFTTNCFKPQPSVISTNVTLGKAEISWGRLPGVNLYEYAITGSPVSPPATQNFTSDTAVHLADLTPGSHYYFHLRSRCSGAKLSSWSVIELTTPGLGVYPNPAHTEFTIRITGKVNANSPVFIYNSDGRLMKIVLLTGNTALVDIRTWAAGIYYVRYGNEKGYVTQLIKW